MKEKNKHDKHMSETTGVDSKNGSSQEGPFNMDINTDDSVSGTSRLHEPLHDEDETEKLQQELQEQKDKYLRLVAEFDNFRKRTAKESLEIRQTAGKEVITSLLQVLDDCERAEKQLQADTDLNRIKEGVQLVFNKLKTTLASKGVKPMQSVGIKFNPDQQEAVAEIPAPSEDMKGKVLDEIEKGYYLNDKIIRFAKVVVGK